MTESASWIAREIPFQIVGLKVSVGPDGAAVIRLLRARCGGKMGGTAECLSSQTKGIIFYRED